MIENNKQHQKLGGSLALFYTQGLREDIRMKKEETTVKFKVKRMLTLKSHLSFTFVLDTTPRPAGGRITSVCVASPCCISSSVVTRPQFFT